MEEQKANPRKRKCEICEEIESKYKCPGCSMQTCSLPCVKEHKIQRNCDGIRSKTEFVKVGEFTDTHLLNDYRFLEDVSRCSSNASRDKKNKRKFQFNHRLNMVAKAKERQIDLRLMTIGMSKQKENTSSYDHREKCFNWRVKFIFVNEDAEFFLPKVQETEVLSDIIKLFVEPEQDDICQYKLKSYIHKGIDNINVYMKKERCKTPGYHKLDLSKTIKYNLKFKTIFEYPTFYVTIDGKDDKFKNDSFEKAKGNKGTFVD